MKPDDRATLQFIADPRTGSDVRRALFARVALDLDARLRALEPCPVSGGRHVWTCGAADVDACHLCSVARPTKP